jgi:CHAD domain-containing protein
LPIAEYAAVHTEAHLALLAWQLSLTAERPRRGAIHELRVTIRRLTNCLRVNRQFFPKRASKRVLRRLRAINKPAGRARDVDIAMKVIFSVLRFPDKSIHRLLSDERREERRRLKKKLGRFIDRDRVRKWSAQLEVLSIDRKERRVSPERAANYAAQVLPSLAVQFFEKGRSLTPYSMPYTFHRFRLRGKRLRDALELFRPCYSSEVDTLINAVREIHQILGDYSDLATTREMLSDRGLEKSRNRLFYMLNARMAEKLDQFDRVWQQGLAEKQTQQRWSEYLATTE